MLKSLYGSQQIIQLNAYSVDGIRHLWIQGSYGCSALRATYNANLAVKGTDSYLFKGE
jgi:hypothetical protein